MVQKAVSATQKTRTSRAKRMRAPHTLSHAQLTAPEKRTMGAVTEDAENRRSLMLKRVLFGWGAFLFLFCKKPSHPCEA